ncbi:hypothetical protein KR200_008202 [Drosophila serrata]|nr:hypothetical protein KR200_008202 [Drosophila serrata]
MLFKTLTIFLVIGAALGSAVPPTFEITEETTLTDFLLHSPVLRSGETFNAGCFDYYLPVIKGHADQLDADFLPGLLRQRLRPDRRKLHLRPRRAQGLRPRLLRIHAALRRRYHQF